MGISPLELQNVAVMISTVSKLAMFYVAMGLGVDFRAGKFGQMIKTIGLTLNDD